MAPVLSTVEAVTSPAQRPGALARGQFESLLGVAAERLRQGRAAEALTALAGFDPAAIDRADHCHLAGLIHVGAEAWAAALPWFARARALRPDYLDAVTRLARVLQRLGRFEEAAEAFDAAAALGLADPAAYYNRGLVLRALGRKDKAIAAFDMALRLKPAYPEALRAGAVILSESGNNEGALKFLEEALRLKPDYYEALLDRANLLVRLDRTAAARAAYQAALEHFPDHPELHNNLGVVLRKSGDLPASLAAFEAAVKARPDYPEALFNRGTTLMKTSGPKAALRSFERALAARPDYPAALVGKGVALKELARFEAAEASFDAAIALEPESAHARNNRAALQLLQGDLRNGWEGYEYRWACGTTSLNELRFPIPQWPGLAAGGKVIVYDEQGLGDTLQFCRYLPLLARADVDVSFFCRSKMKRLLKTLTPQVPCRDDLAEGAKFDYQIALSSLPRALGTELATIPAQVPYLAAEPGLVVKWAARLAAQGPEDAFKIGICWHGNPNPQADPERSLPLAHFALLAQLENVRLVSLQKLHGLDELDTAGFAIETLGDDFDAGADAFVDTAAVMQALDLIVTCDTSVAHLAGALGRPVFLLLKRVPDWRWLLDREDSPWYPTMRLFRQKTRGDWREAMRRVAAAIETLRN